MPPKRKAKDPISLDLIPAPKPRQTGKGKAAPVVVIDDGDDDELDTVPKPPPAKKARKAQPRKKPVAKDEEDGLGWYVSGVVSELFWGGVADGSVVKKFQESCDD